LSNGRGKGETGNEHHSKNRCYRRHGLIGSKTVALLRDAGHDVFAASPSTGVDMMTGEGLAGALEGAYAVIDVSNIASFDETVVKDFFETAGKRLFEAEKAAGVQHHVTLSIVGADGLASNPYMAGKLLQEKIASESGIPYTIVRATQFFEFIPTIADACADGTQVLLPAAKFQPIAADEVAAFLARTAGGSPLNRTIDIAGPERAPFAQIVGRYLAMNMDPRIAQADPAAGYFGAAVDELSLVPKTEAHLGKANFETWSRNRSAAA
jgi:uncharacterized protein YbjT (DUF2867 family)